VGGCPESFSFNRGILPSSPFFSLCSQSALAKSPTELAEFVATRTAAHLTAVRAAFERIYGGNIVEAIKAHVEGLAGALLTGAATRTVDAPEDAEAQVCVCVSMCLCVRLNGCLACLFFLFSLLYFSQIKQLGDATGSLGNEGGPLVAAFSTAGPLHIKGALARKWMHENQYGRQTATGFDLVLRLNTCLLFADATALADGFAKAAGITLVEAVEKEVRLTMIHCVCAKWLVVVLLSVWDREK
jgi:hypothetical protein